MSRRAIVLAGSSLIVAATAFAFACGGSSSGPPGDTVEPDAAPTATATSTTSASNGTDGGSANEGDASATSDAGTNVDAGRDFSSDRGKFFGASRCAGSGLLLCEDFESGALDKGTWTVVGNAPVIDGVQAARGSKALHVSITGNGASYIKETKTFPAKDNTYWGRAFVYFNALPTPSGAFTYAHWTVLAASGTGTVGEIRETGQLQAAGNIFGVGTDSTATDAGTGDWTTSDDDPKGAPKPVPTKSWVCLEWLHAGSTNETRFFWDAVEHPSLHTTSTVHGGNTHAYILPEFTNVWLGWQEYQSATEPFELWIDEIAIDSSRIGCVY